MSGRASFWLTIFSKLYVIFFFNGLLSYLVRIKTKTSKCVTCKRDNSFRCFFENPVHNTVRRFFLSYSKTGVYRGIHYFSYII